jgi:hypothetical protein
MEPKDYSKSIAATMTDKVSHQILFFDPDHPLARKNGMVSLGRHVLSVKLGRWIAPRDIVRYLDGNPQNISPENLELATRAMMAYLVYATRSVELKCPVCGNTFRVSPSHKDRRIYDSERFRHIAERRFDIQPDELRRLVWEMPTQQVAKLYGVSDKAIEKRCQALGISKPPRGYWAKQKSNELIQEEKA